MRLSTQRTKRIVSLMLCLALLVSMLAVALTVHAEEAEDLTDSGADTISYDSSNELADTGAGLGKVFCKNTAGWGAVYAYMWNSTSDTNAAWPGVKMTNTGNNIWSYDYSKAYSNIIFNIGSSQTQTTDLSFPGAGYIYDNSTGKWSVYEVQPTTVNPTTVKPTTISPTTVSPTSGTDTGKTYVYCENEAEWSAVYAYMWNSESDKNADWPGVKMTNVGGNIWRYEYTKNYAKIIFNIGSKQTQTGDMDFPGKDYIYNNETKKWSIYDTSPLQVSSFSTDLESPQYNGVGIMLSASAEGQGTVYYKFSVSGSDGTKVLSDFSTANSVQWVPTIVGTYTLTYDFKDSAGNTNQRTKTYVIEDGLSSVAPYIKTVSPSGGEIQNNKAVNVTANAGGGITGTSLLFYKFTVKNSSGAIVNTPYYTLNKNYSFTPTSLGAYSLTVSVQGSDNNTVERTYNYTSVSSITPTEVPETQPPVIPTQAPTQASTQAPTQAPTMRPTESPVVPILLGDADDDDDVAIMDATYIQRYEVGISLPTPINLLNADVDGDEEVNVMDATLIQRYLAGIIAKFPAEV